MSDRLRSGEATGRFVLEREADGGATPVTRTEEVERDESIPLDRFLDGLKAANPSARLTPEAAAALERFMGAVIASRRHETSGTWADLLGPVASSTVVADLLGTTRHGVDRARRRGHILGVRTKAGRWVYPLRQLCWTSEGEIGVLHLLDDVLMALCATGGETGAARWLATPNRHLGGVTPWTALSGQEAEAVVEAARAQARVWGGR